MTGRRTNSTPNPLLIRSLRPSQRTDMQWYAPAPNLKETWYIT